MHGRGVATTTSSECRENGTKMGPQQSRPPASRCAIRRDDGRISEIALVLGPTVLPHTKGAGRLPRKNAYFEPHRRGRRATIGRTTHAKRFCERLASVLTLEGFRLSSEPDERPIRDGWWSLDVVACVARWKRTLDVLTPAADSDCCLSPVKDALQYSGLLDDDARVCRDRSAAVHGVEDTLVIVLRRTKPDEALADMLGPESSSYFDFRSFDATSFLA